MFLAGWLHLQSSDKLPFVDVIYIPAAHSPLVTRATSSRGAPLYEVYIGAQYRCVYVD